MGKKSKGRERLSSLNRARESIPSHVVGFLRAYQQAIALHQEISTSKVKLSEQAKQVLFSQVLVFAVRAFETFLRDCFVTIAHQDESFLAASINLSRRGLQLDDLEVVEKLAGELGFQNIDAASEFFRPALDSELFDELNKINWSVYVVGGPQGRPWQFRLSEYVQNWRQDLQLLFNERHEIIHNANRLLQIDQQEMLRLIAVAFLVGQLTGVLLGQKTSMGVISTEAPLKYVILLGVAMHTKSKERVLEAFERSKAVADLDGKVGHVGPAILPIGLLGGLDFVDKGPRLSAWVGEVHHIVTKQENGRYLMESLYPIANSTDNNFASVP